MRIEATLLKTCHKTNRAELNLKEGSLNNNPTIKVPLSLVLDFAIGSELILIIEDNIIKKAEAKLPSQEELWQNTYKDVLSILKDIRYNRD